MYKRLLILALAWLPLLWQPTWGQSPAIGINASQNQPYQTADGAQAATDRGTKENPLVVDTLGHHQQTPEERQESEKQAAESKAEEQYHRDVDRWTLRWSAATAIATGVLVLVGIVGTLAAAMTLLTIKRQADTFESKERARLSIIFPPRNPEVLSWNVYVEPNLVPVEISVDVVNDGGTNAFNVVAAAKLDFTSSFEYPIPSGGPDFPLGIGAVVRDATPDKPTKVFIAPMDFGNFIMVQKDLMVKAKAGDGLLHIVGNIRYDDTFGKGHHTPFHFVWRGYKSVIPAGVIEDSYWTDLSERSN